MGFSLRFNTFQTIFNSAINIYKILITVEKKANPKFLHAPAGDRPRTTVWKALFWTMEEVVKSSLHWQRGRQPIGTLADEPLRKVLAELLLKPLQQPAMTSTFYTNLWALRHPLSQ